MNLYQLKMMARKSNKFVLILCGILFFGIAFGQVIDKVVATVNSQIITQSQLDKQLKITRNQMRSSGESIPASNVLRQKVLNQLIDEELQLQVAKKAHITVSEDELNNTIAKIAAQNNISMVQMMKSLSAEGLDEKTYRDQIRRALLIHKVQEKTVASQVTISPQDVAQARNKPAKARPKMNSHTQFHVVDLLSSTESQANSAATALRNNRNNIKSLSDVKKVLDQSDNRSAQINDMGFRPLSQFPNIFMNAISSLNAGDVSDVIKAPNGYHVLLLAASSGPAIHNSPVLTPEQIAYQNKFNEALQTWLRKLRNQSYIKFAE